MRDLIIKYLYINSISFSIFLNTILGGKPYQTFSARNWEWKKENKPNVIWLIDALIFFERDHCMNCWVRWKIGRYAVMTYENKEVCYEPLRHGKIDLN